MSDRIETKALYDRLSAMTDQERRVLLDPICEAIEGKAPSIDGVTVLPNRIFALAVIDLYVKWQQEVLERD